MLLLQMSTPQYAQFDCSSHSEQNARSAIQQISKQISFARGPRSAHRRSAGVAVVTGTRAVAPASLNRRAQRDSHVGGHVGDVQRSFEAAAATGAGGGSADGVAAAHLRQRRQLRDVDLRCVGVSSWSYTDIRGPNRIRISYASGCHRLAACLPPACFRLEAVSRSQNQTRQRVNRPSHLYGRIASSRRRIAALAQAPRALQ